MREDISPYVDVLQSLTAEKRLCIIRRALGDSAQLHLVGGTVRDVFLGKTPSDLDLASILLPDEIRRRLHAAEIRVVDTGLKHQTVTAVPCAGAPGVEITTFRGSQMSPRGGVVRSFSIDEDIRYRDFTINALAFEIETGKFVDVVGGAEDIRGKIVRAVGDPGERFAEDPLRIIRMVRFACETGFSLDENTREASRKYSGLIPGIAVERVREEFSKILVSNSPARGFRLLLELGFLAEFLPEIASFSGYEQNRFHKADLFEHTLEVIERAQAHIVVRLAALFHDIGKPHTLSVDEKGERHFFRHEIVGVDLTRRILRRMRYSHQVIQDVCSLVQTHMRPIEAGPPGLRRLLRDTGELFPLWRDLKQADALACKAEGSNLPDRLKVFDDAIEEIRRGPEVSPLKSLAVNGHDLIELGIEPGPRLGKILRALHERVLDNPELNEKATLLALIPQISANPLP